MLTLSGTVSETAPTESTLIAGAMVTVIADLEADGRSATTGPSGAFQFAALRPGNYTVRVRAEHYVDSSQPLTLAKSQTLPIQIDPVRQVVTITKQDAITASGSCAGPWDPGTSCKVDYVLNVHHAGTLSADVVWTDREVGFFTSLYRSEAGRPSGPAIDMRGGDGFRRFVYDVSARAQYVLEVNAFTETYMTPSRVTPYTVTLTHPN